MCGTSGQVSKELPYLAHAFLGLFLQNASLSVSLFQFWLYYYTVQSFLLFSKINVTKHKVTIFL